MISVYMADVSKTEGNTGGSHGGGTNSCSGSPAETLCPVKEQLSSFDIPKNMKMHGQRANKALLLSAKLETTAWYGDLLHTAIDMPPAITKTPDKAHARFVCMSLGVISSKHCSGLVRSGMTNPSCSNISNGEHITPVASTHGQEHGSDDQATTKVMSTGFLGR